jgi:hypothetical protein
MAAIVVLMFVMATAGIGVMAESVFRLWYADPQDRYEITDFDKHPRLTGSEIIIL